MTNLEKFDISINPLGPSRPEGLRWCIVGCQKYCNAGRIGMDNCNVCGCTGSQLVVNRDNKWYPNTRQGWLQMLADHPEIPDERGD
jgi:hypothetical protein